MTEPTYGYLQGFAGKSLQEIEGLELTALDAPSPRPSMLSGVAEAPHS